ncbi:hypothetical protein Lspi_1926 [Legionella spiritensis]|uniref:Uncharacterized protein n=1 Tax=Legionella spiritensis TaxID=452 RepID=A0A0W0YYX9_LEGSP|nr:hypothetical protein Lspi_1926 [Legionella spiritensis]SNV34313.1 Uncharacterised protein [Legionella spiritensis]
MSKQVQTDTQSLTGNCDYEHLIQAKFAAALKSNDYMIWFKKINFKLNLCIGLLVLKLLLVVSGVS